MDFPRKIKYQLPWITAIILATCSISSCSVVPDSILIKIRDGSKCDLKGYSIEMSEMTVSFSAAQVAAIKGESISSEVVLDIPIARGEPATFSYKIRAEYENCAEIVGNERTAERGYIIYESIYDNKIDYQVRAK